MKPLISVILNAFAIAHAITDERVLLDKGDAQWSLKGIVGIYVSAPLVNVLVTICVFMVVFETGDASIFWSVFIAYWLVIIGVNIWTSGYITTISTLSGNSVASSGTIRIGVRDGRVDEATHSFSPMLHTQSS